MDIRKLNKPLAKPVKFRKNEVNFNYFPLEKAQDNAMNFMRFLLMEER